LPSQSPSPPPSPSPPLPPESPPFSPERHSRLPLFLGASGVVLAATGGILLLTVRGGLADLGRRCAPNCLQSDLDGLQTRADIGYVLLGVGAVSAASAAVWWLIDRGRASERRAAVWVAPTLAGIAAGGRF